jgi:hypothetical protein
VAASAGVRGVVRGEQEFITRYDEVCNEIALREVRVEDERCRLDFIELRTLVKLLGAEHVSMERVLAQWVKVHVPQVISGTDGGVAQALLQAMPFTQARTCSCPWPTRRPRGCPAPTPTRRSW